MVRISWIAFFLSLDVQVLADVAARDQLAEEARAAFDDRLGQQAQTLRDWMLLLEVDQLVRYDERHVLHGHQHLFVPVGQFRLG